MDFVSEAQRLITDADQSRKEAQQANARRDLALKELQKAKLQHDIEVKRYEKEIATLKSSVEQHKSIVVAISEAHTDHKNAYTKQLENLRSSLGDVTEKLDELHIQNNKCEEKLAAAEKAVQTQHAFIEEATGHWALMMTKWVDIKAETYVPHSQFREQFRLNQSTASSQSEKPVVASAIEPKGLGQIDSKKDAVAFPSSHLEINRMSLNKVAAAPSTVLQSEINTEVSERRTQTMTPTVGIKRNNSTSPDISDRPDKRLRQTEDVTDTETESEEIGALKYPVEPSSNESQVPQSSFHIGTTRPHNLVRVKADDMQKALTPTVYQSMWNAVRIICDTTKVPLSSFTELNPAVVADTMHQIKQTFPHAFVSYQDNWPLEWFLVKVLMSRKRQATQTIITAA